MLVNLIIKNINGEILATPNTNNDLESNQIALCRFRLFSV